MRFLLIFVVDLVDLSPAYPTSSATASEFIAFIKQQNVYSSGGPRLTEFDDGPRSNASLL